MSDFDPKILGGSVKRGIVNPDLLEERAKCDLDQRELCVFLYGQPLIDFVEGINDFIERNPQVKSQVNHYEKSRVDKMGEWFERIAVVLKDEKAKHLHISNSKRSIRNFNWQSLFAGQSPLTVHMVMFTDSLLMFGN